jgi:hypothetical protein
VELTRNLFIEWRRSVVLEPNDFRLESVVVLGEIAEQILGRCSRFALKADFLARW